LEGIEADRRDASASRKDEHLTPAGIWVRATDGDCVWLPPELLLASSVLQTLVADDLSEQQGPPGGGARAASGDHSVSWEPPCDGACSAADTPVTVSSFSLAFEAEDLRRVAEAYMGGGFPLALRWEAGDRRGLTAAVSMLCCAHFLDVPDLVAAACVELAVTVLHNRNSAVEVAAQLGVSPMAAALDTAPLPEVEDLVASASALGDRGGTAAAAWASEDCPLSRLSVDVMRDVLSAADELTCHDPSVCEVLAAVHALDLPETAEAQATGDEGTMWTSPLALSKVCRALDMLAWRSERYKGSALLVDALASLLVAESAKVTTDVRRRAMRTLSNLAHPGDAEALAALVAVLEAGHTDRGAIPMDGEKPAESQADFSARCIGLDSGWELRTSACTALEVLALRGSTDVVAASAPLLSHGFVEVRLAAVHLLSHVAGAGDGVAATAVVRALRDDDWRVRNGASKALARLAADGAKAEAKDLVERICACLSDPNPDVRLSVRSALCECAKVRGDVFCIARSHLDSKLRTSEPVTRETIVDTLGDALAELGAKGFDSKDAQGDSALNKADTLCSVLELLIESLRDTETLVRQAAARALGNGSAGHGRALLPKAVRRRIAALVTEVVASSDDDSFPAAEALDVIRFNAARGDVAAVGAICRVLQEQPEHEACSEQIGQSQKVQARRAACVALRDVVEPGDSLAVGVLAHALSDPTVQDEAVKTLDVVALGRGTETVALQALVADCDSPNAARGQALRCLTRTGTPTEDGDVLATALTLFDAEDPSLRGQALLSAAKLASRGDEVTKAAVIETLRKDRHPEVLERAVLAAEALLERGDEDVIEVIVGHVIRGEFCTRQAGLRTLQTIAGHSNPKVISFLLPWLDHGHWPQRQAALQALTIVVARGNERVVAAVVKRLDDSDETCRVAACEALAKLAALGDLAPLAALAARIEVETSWIVRDSTVQTLAALAHDDQAEGLVAPLLASMDEDVRRAAEELVELIAERNHEPQKNGWHEATALSAGILTAA